MRVDRHDSRIARAGRQRAVRAEMVRRRRVQPHATGPARRVAGRRDELIARVRAVDR